jgi:hypothetical protein
MTSELMLWTAVEPAITVKYTVIRSAFLKMSFAEFVFGRIPPCFTPLMLF